MKKKTAAKSIKATPRPPAQRAKGYGQLVSAISTLSTQVLDRVATVANQALVLRNWTVGAYIVEFEQNGADRAKYGARLLETLAGDLKATGVKGLGDPRVLRECRIAFRCYPQIRGTLTREFALPGSTEPVAEISATVSTESTLAIRGTLSPELPTPLSAEEILCFSWSQLQELIRLDDPWKRAFYENECLRGHWSVR